MKRLSLVMMSALFSAWGCTGESGDNSSSSSTGGASNSSSTTGSSGQSASAATTTSAPSSSSSPASLAASSSSTGGSGGTSTSNTVASSTGGSVGTSSSSTVASSTGGSVGTSASNTVASSTGASSGNGASSNGGSGSSSAGPSYAPTTVNAAITAQLSPLGINDPVTFQLGTLSYYPVLLTNPQVTIPPGFVLIDVSEDLTQRVCPTGTNNTRCRQYFDVRMHDAGACRFNGEYPMTFDVSCASGGDCARINPTFTTFQVTPSLSSENFCGTFDVQIAPFRVNAAITQQVSPANTGDPAFVQLGTLSALPYVLTPDTVDFSAVFTLNSFVEEPNGRICPDANNKCRQYFNLTMTPAGSCRFDGDYVFRFNVTCPVPPPAGQPGCDPNLTTHAIHAYLRSENFCP